MRLASSSSVNELANGTHAVWNAAIGSMIPSEILDAAEYEPSSVGDARLITWKRSARLSAQRARPAGMRGSEKSSMRRRSGRSSASATVSRRA